MRQTIQVTVDERGRVTLPAEVRALLGMSGRGRVYFVIDDERIVRASKQVHAGGGLRFGTAATRRHGHRRSDPRGEGR